MERLSTADAQLLELENNLWAVHGLTVGVFDGPEPSYEDILERVRERITLAPRYRQRLIDVPFDIARPVWVDDPHFQLDFHVRHTALPEREEKDALAVLVSRLLSQRLDRGKPLWELWFVSNLKDGHWGLISKVHYAVVDGVSGTDLFGLLLDDVPTPTVSQTFAPGPLPRPVDLIAPAIGDALFSPVEQMRAARDLALTPIRAGKSLVRSLRPRATDPSISRVVGPHRRWQRLRLPLADLRKIRDVRECTTTDVIVAAITGGIRHYLIERDEPVPRRISALIPLAVASEDTGFNQDVAALRAPLPVGIDDPVLRLETIAANTRIGARREGAVAGTALRRQDYFSAPTVMALGVRAAMIEARDTRDVDTVAVNVPGPADTQSLLGNELLKAYPVVPLAARVRMAFAAMSYRDDLSIGITGDWDSAPELELVADGIRATVDDLRP